MENDFLLGVLREIQAYAIKENCIGLMPLIDNVYEAAAEELKPSVGSPTNATDVLSRISSTLTQDVGAPPSPFTSSPFRRSKLRALPSVAHGNPVFRAGPH